MPMSPTYAALILLAVNAGAIWATILFMIHIWLASRAVAAPAGRHRTDRPRRSRGLHITTAPHLFDALSEDLTPLHAPRPETTRVFAAPVDPWAGAEDDIFALVR